MGTGSFPWSQMELKAAPGECSWGRAAPMQAQEGFPPGKKGGMDRPNIPHSTSVSKLQEQEIITLQTLEARGLHYHAD